MQNKERVNAELLKTLAQHKEYITSVRKWDEYARERNLPSSAFLIKMYGSWNNLKECLQLPSKNKRYDREVLLDIGRTHSEYFGSKRDWDNYARESGFPSSSTFIKAFGSWNQVKEALNLTPLDRIGPKGYSKEELIEILSEHAENFQDSVQWNEYAKSNDLPTYKTLRKYFKYEELSKYLQPSRNRPHNRQSLINIGVKYNDKFQNSSMEEWNVFAKENNLPSAHTFHRNFGSWRSAKTHISKIVEEKSTNG